MMLKHLYIYPLDRTTNQFKMELKRYSIDGAGAAVGFFSFLSTLLFTFSNMLDDGQ